MTKYILPLILASLLCSFSSTSLADDQASYASQVGNKALNGFANISTAVLEIPKNIINTTNDSNIFYGFFGGMFKGFINTFGRLIVGVSDLVTAPVPTNPIAQPVYIWDDFDRDTTFGETYRLNNE